jgi:hypothetical protein
MSWLVVTSTLYRRAFSRAGRLAFRNWPVLGTVFIYAFVMRVAALVAGGLGLLGGFLVTLVWASCVGSFLYLVEMLVRTGRVSWGDFRRSFGVYVWEVVGVSFVLWIVFALATPALRTIPQGPGMILALDLLIFVFFNAVPELIYLGHSSSLELLAESYTFITENWIEWFPASIAAAMVLALVASVPLVGVLAWVQTAVVALLVYVAMIARGLLFLELHGSSRRARAFRHRTGG